MLHTTLVTGIYSISEMTTWAPVATPLPIEAIKVQRVRKCKGLETYRGEYRITHLQLENCYFDNLFIGNVIETGGLSDSQVVVFTGHKQTDEYGIF